MHGSDVTGFLGGYYLCLAMMNAVVAFYFWHKRHDIASAVVWVSVSMILVAVASAAFGGSPPGLPHSLREAVNAATGPVIYSVGTTAIRCCCAISSAVSWCSRS